MVSTIYPASHYVCCMRHLGENIRNNFHNSKVVIHFYKAIKAYDRCEFNDHFNQKRDLVPKAAETLERLGFHTWNRAFYSRNRYNIMTSNIAESVNSMFDVEREFPIIALFDEINSRFALLFHQRRMELVNSTNRFIPSIEKDISKYVNVGNKLLSHQIATTMLRAQYGADFGNQTYEYSFPYYSMEKYIMAYCEEIHPVPLEDSWIVPLDIIEREIPLSKVDPSKPGRRRYKRRRGVGGSFPTRKNKCSFQVLNQVANEHSVYQKFDLFSHNDPTALGMINQAADGGHIGASYVLSIISIFNDDESMKEGGMWVLEPNLLGGKPICCTVHQFEQIGRRNGWPIGSDNEDDIRCDLELDYVVKFHLIPSIDIN
ncbi:hypothetical protein H5410_015427 [Solanum commersonii]|uniref:Uncharacterized protein n=1 Tax=Solanum commersonii TaxID=4109 RepID=A0A9J5ZU20_SOLCO|nr:hypothetical protein H5410_015427 [Solanum commersonii]